MLQRSARGLRAALAPLCLVVLYGVGPTSAVRAQSTTPTTSTAPVAPTGPAAPAVPPIAYPSVAEALRALEARDGQDAVVTHNDGWTVVSEPLASAQWSFVPPDHAAYPAVVRRVIVHGAQRQVSVDTAKLCEGPVAACDALLQQFAAMNDRIVQAAKARGRGGSTPPAAN